MSYEWPIMICGLALGAAFGWMVTDYFWRNK